MMRLNMSIADITLPTYSPLQTRSVYHERATNSPSTRPLLPRNITQRNTTQQNLYTATTSLAGWKLMSWDCSITFSFCQKGGHAYRLGRQCFLGGNEEGIWLDGFDPRHVGDIYACTVQHYSHHILLLTTRYLQDITRWTCHCAYCEIEPVLASLVK